MDDTVYKALLVEKNEDDQFIRTITERKVSDLPAGEVLVRVGYSSLNYKDALSASGNRGVTRRYPHTPGIDAAGVVVESDSAKFLPGEQVIVSCYDLGMNTPGGFGQYIRVPAAWVMKLPAGLSLQESMIYGTGGFTAAHSVWRLVEYGITPEQGKILVTGATGGVGSFSVAILAKLGYTVTAVSGKDSAHDFLRELGAVEVIGRAQAIDTSGRMVLKGRWAGVVDTVGGAMLATAIRSTRYGGAVTCCGNVAEPEFLINVYPFILRGVSLFGIDSAQCPMALREKIWALLAAEWKIDNLGHLGTEITMDQLDTYLARMLKGGIMGRIVVNMS
ncbi:MAG: YhdH/YhfP family quinone oxidoreductase [Proteobacteria bacterium]|nr:YhdH/YhfP family quinone oxidoreductase [Pseudomonadota bacterium]MBU1716339.1 YhdH/YhfP family quinone oxidoreductase [Pseudomonadota bacterium]